MILPKLFCKRDGDQNQFQEWIIEVAFGAYRTVSGMVGGKLQTSEWTKCFGKNVGKANETTDEQQAASEAQSKWQHKYDEGYRQDIKDLGKDNIFWPMLAKKFKDYQDKISWPVKTQQKLNGIRIAMKDTGAWSRHGKKFLTLKHLEDVLIPICKKNMVVIDGEGYSDDLSSDFEKICSLIKKTKPTEENLKETASKVKMHVYDCYFINEPKLIFSERFSKISEILKDIKEVQLVETYTASNLEQLDEYYKQFLKKGYEGQMIRTDTPYENKRTKALLKRKQFTDEEFIITGYTEGKGNKQGMVASLSFLNKEGKPFNSNMKGSFEYLRSLWGIKDTLIGKEATVKYFCLTKEDKVPYLPHVIAIDRKSYE